MNTLQDKDRFIGLVLDNGFERDICKEYIKTANKIVDSNSVFLGLESEVGVSLSPQEFEMVLTPEYNYSNLDEFYNDIKAILNDNAVSSAYFSTNNLIGNFTQDAEGENLISPLSEIEIPYVSGTGEDQIFDFSVLNNEYLNKNAYLGNAFGLPEHYDFPWPNDIYYKSFTKPNLGITVRGIFFGDNGTKLYEIDANSNEMHQSTLSVAWDINTAVSDSITVATQGINSQDIYFSPDGLIMYECSPTNIYEYDLSVAWDLSTAVYNTVNVLTQDTFATGIQFNNDGTKLYELGISTDKIYQYTLSTAWDLSTAVYDTVSIGVQGTAPVGFNFKPDGTKIYSICLDTDKMYQYTLSTPWDISTLTYDNISIDNINAASNDVVLSLDGTRLYEVGAGADVTYQYTLIEPWDLSTAKFGSYHWKLKDFHYRDLEAQMLDITNVLFGQGIFDGKGYGLNCTTFGTGSLPSTTTHGVWEFDLYVDLLSNAPMIDIMTDQVQNIATASDGYSLRFLNGNITFNRAHTSNLFTTVQNYIEEKVDYRLKVVRNSVVDEFVVGPIDTIALYIKGGSFGLNYTLVDTTGGSGTNPITDSTYNTSTYFVLDVGVNDRISNIEINGTTLDTSVFTNDTGVYEIDYLKEVPEVLIYSSEQTGTDLERTKEYCYILPDSYGPNVIPNGDFSSGTANWDLISGFTITDKAHYDGLIDISSIGQSNQFLTANKLYQIRFDISNATAGADILWRSRYGVLYSTIRKVYQNGTHTEEVIPTANAGLRIYSYISGGAGEFDIDNIEFREVTRSYYKNEPIS